MKLKPKVHHSVSSTTENQAPDTLPRKSGAVSPNHPNAWLTSPVSGVYMNAKIRHTIEEGTTYGAKNASRKNHSLREIRAANMAKTRGSSTSKGVVRSVNSVECHIEAQKSPLLRTSA